MKLTSKLTVLRLPLAVLGVLIGIYANYILLAPPRMTKEDAHILDFAQDNLMYLTSQTRDNSSDFLKSAKAEVEKEGNRLESVAFLEKMGSLKKKTTSILVRINEIKSKIWERRYKAWAKKDSSTWRNGLDIEESEIYSLHNDLARYDSLLANIDTVGKRALKQNQIPLLTADAEKKFLTQDAFNKYYFNVTEALGLYNLTRLEAEVAYREHIVMKSMFDRLRRINMGDIRFDRFQPFATAESEVVEEGQTYKASVFFASYFNGNGIPLRMSSSEGAVEVKEGIGHVKFKATANKFDEKGLAKKTWKGAITLRTTRGTDTTFSVETEYFVKKKQ